MIGMAMGTKAMSASRPVDPSSRAGRIPPAGLGENISKPIRMRMIPPTMRTMERGIPNTRNTRFPKSRKKNSSIAA